MKKNGEATGGRASIMKCGETPLEYWGTGVKGWGVACENPVVLSMCDVPIETFKYISVNI